MRSAAGSAPAVMPRSARQRLDRIARDEADQGEDEQRDAEEGRDDEGEALEDEGEHQRGRGAVPGAASRPLKRGVFMARDEDDDGLAAPVRRAAQDSSGLTSHRGGPRCRSARAWLTASLAILAVSPAFADPFFFSTGDPDGLIATASRPDSPGRPEIESADDFVLTQNTRITGGSFTGLLTGGASLASISEVVVEIYRVFPLDSDVGRTSVRRRSRPRRCRHASTRRPTWRSRRARPPRRNCCSSPRSSQMSFTANNSVLNGIHPMPGQFTGGDGCGDRPGGHASTSRSRARSTCPPTTTSSSRKSS